MAAPPKRVLCPYCGNKSPVTAERCEACGGFFDDLSRRVTQQHMGPWYLRDPEHPFRPGCSFAVIAKQVEKGKITTTTVLRGPTTKQFWAMAGHVPGVAHLLGVCHACSEHVERTAQQCGKCGAAFPRPDDRDELGLDPENPRVFEEAAKAQAEYAAQQAALRQQQAAQPAASAPAPAAAKARVVETVSQKPAQPVSSASPAAPGKAGPESAKGRTTAPARAPAAAAAAATPAVAVSRAQPDLDTVAWMTPSGPPDPQAVPVGVDASRRGGGSLWLWALVGVNVLLAVAVVFILMGKDNEDLIPDSTTPPAVNDTSETPATTGRPGTPSSSNTTPAGTKPPKTPGTPGTPATPATGIVVKPGNGQTIVVGPGETVTIPAPATTPTPDTTPTPSTGIGTEATPPIKPDPPAPSGGVSFFGIEAVPGAPRVTQAQIDELNRQFEEANQLAIEAKWHEALQKLEHLKANMPKGVKSDQLDSVIDYVRKQVESSKKVNDFFDG